MLTLFPYFNIIHCTVGIGSLPTSVVNMYLHLNHIRSYYSSTRHSNFYFVIVDLFIIQDIIAILVIAGGHLYGVVFMYLWSINWSHLASSNADADIVGSISTTVTATMVSIIM